VDGGNGAGGGGGVAPGEKELRGIPGCESDEGCGTDAGGSWEMVSIYDDGVRRKARGVPPVMRMVFPVRSGTSVAGSNFGAGIFVGEAFANWSGRWSCVDAVTAGHGAIFVEPGGN
jgi:hypothetical protein